MYLPEKNESFIFHWSRRRFSVKLANVPLFYFSSYTNHLTHQQLTALSTWHVMGAIHRQRFNIATIRIDESQILKDISMSLFDM